MNRAGLIYLVLAGVLIAAPHVDSHDVAGPERVRRAGLADHRRSFLGGRARLGDRETDEGEEDEPGVSHGR